MTPEPVGPDLQQAKPYKGAESYRSEDAHRFFGRGREAEELVARILGFRSTLLHAQSGAGKTSLLNARIVPLLESKGWIPVVTRPGQDPTVSLRTATLQNLLPEPAFEAAALRRAMAALGGANAEVTVGDLLDRFDALSKRDLNRTLLVAAVESAGASVYPWFCRLLRSSISIEDFAGHLAVIDPELESTSLDTAAASLAEKLTSPQFQSDYQRLSELLDRDFPDLADFFANLTEIYGRKRLNFGIVLIMDQFEELFTRFIGSGQLSVTSPGGLPHYTLRLRFFEELRRIFRKELDSRLDGSKAPLPIRFVISTRDEYIAQLEPLRVFITDLATNTFHLSLLNKEQARSAIEKPAKMWGYAYAEDCYIAISEELTREDQYVEPAHLQIVCEKLWTVSGEAIATRTGDGELPEISLEVFQKQNGVSGMLRSFFLEFLDTLDRTDRVEALEMLSLLVTPSRTRNILEERYLTEAPLRDAERRREILAKLIQRIIVRAENRLRGKFVEITHEFLIGPILDATAKELSGDPGYLMFRSALHSLEQLQTASLAWPGTRLLHDEEFRALHKKRIQVRWDARSTETMFRSAILTGQHRDAVRHWAEELRKYPAESVAEITAAAGRMRCFSLTQTNAVNAARAELEADEPLVAAMFASEMIHGDCRRREDIEYWSKRLTAYEQQSA